MRKYLLSLLALLLIPLGGVQGAEQKTASFAILYDLDATAITYPLVTGLGGSPWGSPMAGSSRIKTTGSSASVTEATASTNPFTDLSVGDLVMVNLQDGTTDLRVIITRTDAANIILNAAVDWSATGGVAFRWLKQTTGTAVTNGWIDISGMDDVTMTIYFDQINVTGGVDMRWECKAAGVNAAPVIVYPGESDGCGSAGTLGTNVCNLTGTAGITSGLALVVTEPWTACRLGLFIHTSDDGADTTTNTEQITATLTGRTRR